MVGDIGGLTVATGRTITDSSRHGWADGGTGAQCRGEKRDVAWVKGATVASEEQGGEDLVLN